MNAKMKIISGMIVLASLFCLAACGTEEGGGDLKPVAAESAAPAETQYDTKEAETPVETEPPGCSHSKTKYQVVSSATCGSSGKADIVCEFCGEVVGSHEIAATGEHTWETEHVEATGRYEYAPDYDNMEYYGEVTYSCGCGFYVGDYYSLDELEEEVKRHKEWCDQEGHYGERWEPGIKEEWVETSPAYDKTYCTVCGATK